MSTLCQRISSAFAVLCGQYGDVTNMARDREQSRQSLYREAEQVAQAVDGAAAQARQQDGKKNVNQSKDDHDALDKARKDAENSKGGQESGTGNGADSLQKKEAAALARAAAVTTTRSNASSSATSTTSFAAVPAAGG